MAKRLKKMMSLGHSIPGPGSTGGAALLKETMGKVKKKLKKKKLTDMEKALSELEEVEQLTKGKVKEMAQDDLEKMSRPKITFPHFKKLSTRPDQEVQTIENGRQKEMYGRKVANANYKDAHNVPHTQMTQSADGKLSVASQSSKTISQQATRDKASKRLAGTFDRNTLGLNAPTKEGPKSSALVGKLRSKFEEGDDEYQTKLLAHKQKRAAAVTDYNKKYTDWYHKAYALSNKTSEPGGKEAYEAHRALKPEKPNLGRAPSKKSKATTDLTPANAKKRGQAVDATINHEGFHHTMAEMENHYGKQTAAHVHKQLLSHFHPDTLASVGGFISNKMGYKPRSPKFTEEILAHSRDILSNPAKREAYKKYAGDKADQHIKNMKQGHQKAYEYAQKVKPEDVKKSVQAEIKSKAQDILKKIKP